MKKNYKILKLVLAILFILVGAIWLSKIHSLFTENHVIALQSVSCAVPSVLIVLGWMLICSVILKNKFIEKTSTVFGSIFWGSVVDFFSGLLLALGMYIVLVFFSPPLPFVPSLSCATNWNDVTYLVIAMFLLVLRTLLIKLRSKQENK